MAHNFGSFSLDWLAPWILGLCWECVWRKPVHLTARSARERERRRDWGPTVPLSHVLSDLKPSTRPKSFKVPITPNSATLQTKSLLCGPFQIQTVAPTYQFLSSLLWPIIHSFPLTCPVSVLMTSVFSFRVPLLFPPWVQTCMCA